MTPSRATLPVLALLALGLTGCGAPARGIDGVRAGMDRRQVQALIGPPDTVAHAPGKECAYYALLKDFWSRVPWSMSERYYVCYGDGKVESFGKVDAAPSG